MQSHAHPAHGWVNLDFSKRVSVSVCRAHPSMQTQRPKAMATRPSKMHPACLHHGEGAIVYVSVRLRVSLRSSHARIRKHILDTHRHPNAQMQCRCTAMPLCEPPLETKQQLRRWCPAKWRTATPSQSCTRQLRRHDAKSNHTINSIATLSVLYCHVCASSSLCLSPLAHSYRFGEDDVKKGYGA